MSIQLNMTNAQEFQKEEFMNNKCDFEDYGGHYRKIEKLPSPSQPSHPFEFHIPMADTTTETRKRRKPNEKNHVEEPHDHEIHIWAERERRKKMKDMFAKLHALLPQLPAKAEKSAIVDEAVNSIHSLEQTLRKLQMQRLEKPQYSSAPNTTITPTSAYNLSSSSSPTTPFTPIPNHPQILSVGAATADSYSREAFLADHISSSSNLPYPRNDTIMFDTWSSQNVVLNICGNEAIFNICFPKNKSGAFTNVCYFLEKYNIEVLYASVSSNVSRRNYMIQAQVNLNHENKLLGEGFGVGDIFKQAAQELVLYVSSP